MRASGTGAGRAEEALWVLQQLEAGGSVSDGWSGRALPDPRRCLPKPSLPGRVAPPRAAPCEAPASSPGPSCLSPHRPVRKTLLEGQGLLGAQQGPEPGEWIYGQGTARLGEPCLEVSLESPSDVRPGETGRLNTSAQS